MSFSLRVASVGIVLLGVAFRAQAEPVDPLERARRTCTPGARCEAFVDVARQAQGGDVRAIGLLADIREPRSAGVLVHIAVYGANIPVRSAADEALARLANTEIGQASLTRIRDASMDPELADVAARHLAAAADRPPGGPRGEPMPEEAPARGETSIWP